MKTRLTHHKAFKKLMRGELPDVIDYQISDHRPLLHNNILFWNVMKQGGPLFSPVTNKLIGYDNGFGFKENQQQYQLRLALVGFVIAALIRLNPCVDAIMLCEGPIKSEDISFLFLTLKYFAVMKRFLTTETFQRPSVTTANWGLLALSDGLLEEVDLPLLKQKPQPKELFKLADRFQLWRLRKSDSTKYIIQSHFPLDNNFAVTATAKLNVTGKRYCAFINNLLGLFAEVNLVFCGDFNFNPYLIGNYIDRFNDLIPIGNSQMSEIDRGGKFVAKAVSVDGMLLTQRAKQMAYSVTSCGFGLFHRLAREARLGQDVHSSAKCSFVSKTK